MDARLGGRHAEHAEKRPQRQLPAVLVLSGVGIRVECPPERPRLELGDAEALVEGRCETAGVRDAPLPDTDRSDPDLERLPRTRSAHLDRPDESVPAIELGVSIAELLVLERPPAGVEARDDDRIALLDRQHGLEVGREVAVERPSLERELVDRHAKASTVCAASRMRSSDGMYTSSSCQNG